MAVVSVPGLASRHLDAASRMGEILFGLIMTLTFTLGAGLVIQEEGRAGAREMLIAILGCNLAWGIIDGALYVLGEVFERGRLRRVAKQVRQAASDEAASRVIAGEFEERLAPLADESLRHEVYRSAVLRLRAAAVPPNRVRRADLMGGLAAGGLVFACSFPAILPFLVLDDPRLALRTSNVILLGLLFFVGHRAARHTLARPWLAGGTFLLIGLFLVLIAIALGG